MDQNRLAHNEVISLAGALWKLLWREYSEDLHRLESGQMRERTRFGPADAQESLTDKETERAAWSGLLSKMQQDNFVQNSQMTIASFVENKFVPEHVALKRSSGRAHYRSMLKHVLRPEEVDPMFSVKRGDSKKKLKAVPGWPYLSNVRLCDAQPEHVSRLISAALARGYSTQTVRHLRNVVSAIFSHAEQEECFSGDNPASLVKPPEIRRKQTNALTLADAKEALSLMKYPEREMTLLAIFTGMNLTETLGLQWKHVNLCEAERDKDGKRIAPPTIDVRNQLYRGRLEGVKKNRRRDLPIPEPLLQILRELRSRGTFIGPDDFVFISRVGSPVNQNNLLARRIRPIAKQLGVSSLSFPAFHRIRRILTAEFEMRLPDLAQLAVVSFPVRDSRVHEKWHCRVQTKRIYTGNELHRTIEFS